MAYRYIFGAAAAIAVVTPNILIDNSSGAAPMLGTAVFIAAAFGWFVWYAKRDQSIERHNFVLMMPYIIGAGAAAVLATLAGPEIVAQKVNPAGAIAQGDRAVIGMIAQIPGAFLALALGLYLWITHQRKSESEPAAQAEATD